MRAFILLCLLPSCCCLLGIFGKRQAVGVLGTLKCNGVPAAGVKVKLYDKEILLDRKLAEGKTDALGSFMISGNAKEMSKIDPQLNIYHKCNHKGPCYKKLSIKIPSKYITKGKEVKEFYNIGTLELSLKVKGQTTDCIN